MAAAAPPLIVPPTAEHTSTLIFSHGVTQTADVWLPFAERLSKLFPNTKFILPNAPIGALQAKGNALVPMWYQIFYFNPPPAEVYEEDEEGMLFAVERVWGWIEEEKKAGVPAEKIVIGGFSQGAAVSVLATIMAKEPLAGAMILSGFTPLLGKIKDLVTPAAKETPIFWGHGKEDPGLDEARATQGQGALRSLGLDKIDFKWYSPMAHELIAEEEVDIVAWLKRVLGPAAADATR